jgi:hypothetical protein
MYSQGGGDRHTSSSLKSTGLARDENSAGTLTGAEYDTFAPSDARTNPEPAFRLSTLSPSNASMKSAYALAALSSSSLFFASAASFSFSRRDLRTVPCAY